MKIDDVHIEYVKIDCVELGDVNTDYVKNDYVKSYYVRVDLNACPHFAWPEFRGTGKMKQNNAGEKKHNALDRKQCTGKKNNAQQEQNETLCTLKKNTKHRKIKNAQETTKHDAQEKQQTERTLDKTNITHRRKPQNNEAQEKTQTAMHRKNTQCI